MTVNFQPVIEQFGIYLSAKCSEPPKLGNLPVLIITSEGREADKRLRQLHWLCQKVGEYEANSVEFLHSVISQVNSSEADVQAQWEAQDAAIENSFEMETLVESFYYIASRLRHVIRQLPDLGGFKCQGVSDVRHHLLEHPDRPDSGVLFGVMSSGNSESGPVLRSMREPMDNTLWPDAGLWVNAREFERNLTRKITAALALS